MPQYTIHRQGQPGEILAVADSRREALALSRKMPGTRVSRSSIVTPRIPEGTPQARDLVVVSEPSEVIPSEVVISEPSEVRPERDVEELGAEVMEEDLSGAIGVPENLDFDVMEAADIEPTTPFQREAMRVLEIDQTLEGDALTVRERIAESLGFDPDLVQAQFEDAAGRHPESRRVMEEINRLRDERIQLQNKYESSSSRLAEALERGVDLAPVGAGVEDRPQNLGELARSLGVTVEDLPDANSAEFVNLVQSELGLSPQQTAALVRDLTFERIEAERPTAEDYQQALADYLEQRRDIELAPTPEPELQLAPPEDFFGGIDTPAVQQQLREQRERLESVGVRVNDDGSFNLPVSPNEAQIAAIQEVSGLSRVEIIGPGIEQRSQELAMLGKAQPISVIGSPSAAMAASIGGLRTSLEERAERRRVIAEQGIPEEISDRLENVQFREELYLREPQVAASSAEFLVLTEERRILSDIVDQLEQGNLSIPQAQSIIEELPTDPTEEQIREARRNLGLLLPFASPAPFLGVPAGIAGTYLTYAEDTPTQRAINIGTDVLGVVTLGILPIATQARSLGALPTAARAGALGKSIAVAEVTGPAGLITAPQQIGGLARRSITAPIEIVLHGRSRLPGAIEQSRQTLRFPAEPGAGVRDIGVAPMPGGSAEELLQGVYTPQDIKEAVSQATLNVIQTGQPATVRVAESGTSVTIEPGLIQKTLGQGATTASPDIRTVIGDGYVIEGTEGGTYFSVAPHTRFADATSRGANAPSLNEITRLMDTAERLERIQPGTQAAIEARKIADDALNAWKAFDDRITALGPDSQTRQLIESGQLPNDPLPGIVLLNDPELLSQLRGAEMLPSGSAQGVVIGSPINEPKIYRPQGPGTGLAEVEAVLPNGVKLPKASQVLYFRGPDNKRYAIAVVGQPLTDAQIAAMQISKTGETVLNLVRPPVRMTFEGVEQSQQLLEEAARLRASGQIEQAALLERQANDLIEQSASAANIIRSDNINDMLRQADTLEVEARELRSAGQLDQADDLLRQAADLRESARIYREDALTINAAARLPRAGVSDGFRDTDSLLRDAERLDAIRAGDDQFGDVYRDSQLAEVPRREIDSRLNALTRMAGLDRALTIAERQSIERVIAELKRSPLTRAERARFEADVQRIAARSPEIARSNVVRDIPGVRPPATFRVPSDTRIPSVTRIPTSFRPPTVTRPPSTTRIPDESRPPGVTRIPDGGRPPDITRPPRDGFEPPEFERDELGRLNVQVIGLNRGFLDTSVDLVTGETLTVKNIEQIPEGRGLALTPLTYSREQPVYQRIKFGFHDLIITPEREKIWVQPSQPTPRNRAELNSLKPRNIRRRRI